jgi:hypothetical protein
MRELSLAVIWILTIAAAGASPALTGKAEPVRVQGYDGDAMEPFLSRDARFLFFNTSNDPGVNTDVHFAEWNGSEFFHRGILTGTSSYALDGAPTMSADGRFCFVSPRDYRRFLATVYCGVFDGKRLNLMQLQKTLPAERLGRLIFHVELANDGRSMIYAEGTFGDGQTPEDADLYLAVLGTRGFIRSPDSTKILAKVNTGDLEYAPALSADGLELFFTRVSGWPFSGPRIFRAERASVDEPFGEPARVNAVEGFVEGPSLAADGTLYFHKREDGHFAIWRKFR